jgi:hypothetical protein
LPAAKRGWWREAACLGFDRLYFSTGRTSQAIAVAICGTFPMRGECEADVRLTERAGPRFGVMAGFTPEQRVTWR